MPAQYISNYSVDLHDRARVRYGGTIAFEDNSQANVINVSLYENGAEYSGGGTVSAVALRSNGDTVAITGGSIVGNLVSITLNANCYLYTGMLTVSIQLTSGDVTTTILSIVFQVAQTGAGEDPIDPSSEITASVSTLTADIADAVATIPASYTNLINAVSATFSSSTPYLTEDFVWYEGVLYRFTSDHPAGTWIGTDVETVSLGDAIAGISDLKSAINEGKDYYSLSWARRTINGTGAWEVSTTRITTVQAYAFDSDVTIVYPSGMRGVVYYYSDDEILASNLIGRFGSDWATGTFTFTPVSGRYYAIVASYTNNASIETSAASAISISTVSKIGELEADVTSLTAGTNYIKSTLNISQVDSGDTIVDANSSGFTYDAYIGQSDGTIEYSGNWILTDYIPVQPGKQYSYTGQLFTGAYIGYYGSNKNFISAVKATDTGSATSFTITIPSNVYYLRASCHNPSTNNFNMTYVGTESYFTQDAGFAPSVELYVNDLYAVVGDTLQIFYDSVVYSNIDGVWVDISCTKGEKYERYWQYTPAAADVGSYSVVFTVYDVNMSALLTKTVSLTVKAAANPASALNVLCIGDSMVADGQTPIELSRRLKGTVGTATSPTALALSNYSLVGRVKNGDETVGWEGTGGKTWAWYISSDSPFYFNGALDVSTYVSTYCGGQVDVVIILLGINDMALYSNDDNYDTLISNATTFIEAIHTALPNAKIILDGNVKRGGGFIAKFRHMTGLRLNKRYKALADSLSYVYFNDSNAQFDSEYAYNTTAVPVDTRSEITYQHVTDFTHPGNTGWWQRADSWFRALINLS